MIMITRDGLNFTAHLILWVSWYSIFSHTHTNTQNKYLFLLTPKIPEHTIIMFTQKKKLYIYIYRSNL